MGLNETHQTLDHMLAQRGAQDYLHCHYFSPRGQRWGRQAGPAGMWKLPRAQVQGWPLKATVLSFLHSASVSWISTNSSPISQLPLVLQALFSSPPCTICLLSSSVVPLLLGPHSSPRNALGDAPVPSITSCPLLLQRQVPLPPACSPIYPLTL